MAYIYVLARLFFMVNLKPMKLIIAEIHWDRDKITTIM